MIRLNTNELTLDNVGQWPRLIQISVVLILVCLMIGLGYWLIAKETFEQYDVLKNEMIGLKQNFELKQHQASNLGAYRHQMQIMQDRFGHMLKQLPTQNEMPGLLEDISKTGIASGLTFESFTPLAEVQHDFYIELPIKINVEGNYHQFAVFLSRVAQMSRIITLHDFTISHQLPEKQNNTTVDKNLSNDLLDMEMTAKIYRYRTS